MFLRRSRLLISEVRRRNLYDGGELFFRRLLRCIINIFFVAGHLLDRMRYTGFVYLGGPVYDEL